MKANIIWAMQLACAGIFLSCANKRPVLNSKDYACDECITFKNYISANWAVDSTGYYYFKNPPVCEGPDYIKTGLHYTGLMGNKCFKGQSVDSVLVYWGQPSKKINNRFDYYLNPKCQGKARGDSPNIPGCIRLQVYFDENGKVVGVGGLIRE
jgi:hypothetical protein